MSPLSQTIQGHELCIDHRASPAVVAETPGAFVGRNRELLELQAERRRSETGELRVAVVLGAAGMGKTRLTAELLARGSEGSVVLRARASRLTPTPPLARWATALGRRHRAERLVDAVGEVSSDTPVVIVLDDAHWADDSFWGLVLALSQEHPDSCLQIVTTARPNQLAGNRAAVEVFSTLEQDEVLRRVQLGPLRRDDVAELAEQAGLGTPPPALVDWLMVRSQGIPRFVVGLLHGVVGERSDPHAPAPGDVPEGLARSVQAELAQLDRGPRALLELLAVVANPVDPCDLAEIAGEPVDDVAVNLEALVRSGVVVEPGRSYPLGYEIAHPVIRDVLYASLGGARRQVLHQRAAGTLVNTGRAEAATLHLLRSARIEDGDAIDALIAQVRDAEHRGSQAMLRAIVPTLVDVLPAGDTRWLALFDALSPPRRPPVSRSTRSRSTGGPRTAQDSQVQEEAILRMLDQLAGVGDVYRRATLVARTADFVAGDAEPGSEEIVCGEAAALCRDAARDHDARMAGIELANGRGWSGDLLGQEADARRLLRGAEEAGDQSAVVGALGTLGLAFTLQGRFAEAEEVLLRGVAQAAPADRALVEAHTNALLATQDALQGHMTSARARWSQASESGSGSAVVWESGVFIALLSGDLPTVTARAQRAELDPPGRPSLPWLALFSAIADAEQGRVAHARSSIDRIAREYEGDDLDLFSQYRRWAEGLVAWAEGRLTTAVAVFQRAVDRCSTTGASALMGLILIDLAEVAATAGDPSGAAKAAAAAEDLAQRVGAPSFQAFHHFADAWSLLALGRPDDAAKATRRAADALRAVGYPLLEARARVAYARSVRNNRVSAVAALDGAIAAFECNGATLRAGRARVLLSEIASNPDRVTQMLGEPSLTGRERQIAELAASGFTARQIGDRLHIGVRTVETHLARVYRKLGVGSKQQLVSRRVELGLATGP